MPFMRTTSTAVSIALCAFSTTASMANDVLLFSDNSLSVLQGGNFKVTGDKAAAYTFEHASGWSFGNLFMFFDYLDYYDNPNQGSSWYGEISPNLSLVKTGLLSISEDSLFGDFSIAGNYERGRGGTEALLLGLGTSLKLEGFSFFNINLYARKDTSLGAGFEDLQATVSWRRPFTIGNQNFVIDGFSDYVFGWGPKNANWHFVPQIKWDLGKAINVRPGKLWLGTEVDLWTNKFGLKNSDAFKTNQLAASFILKVHF